MFDGGKHNRGRFTVRKFGSFFFCLPQKTERICCACLSVEWLEKEETEKSYRTLTSSTASFGSRTISSSLSEDVELVLADPLDAATDLINANVADKIVLVEYGHGCDIVDVALRAQTKGAAAVIIYSRIERQPMKMAAAASGKLDQLDDEAVKQRYTEIKIPVVSISQSDGKLLKTAVEKGTAKVTLRNSTTLNPLLRSSVVSCPHVQRALSSRGFAFLLVFDVL